MSDIPKIAREWQRRMAERGRCIQCQHPWHDGICSCPFNRPLNSDERRESNEIAALAIASLHFESTKSKPKKEMNMEQKIRRINLYGGPGSGKSFTARNLVNQIASFGFQVELVHEFVKLWAFQGRQPEGCDQIFLYANQLHLEDSVLRSSDEVVVVTDSPLLLNNWYGHDYNFHSSQQMIEMTRNFEEQYPSLNIWLNREGLTYSETGRFQKLEEAKAIDERLSKFLTDKLNVGDIRNLYVCGSKNSEEIERLVELALIGEEQSEDYVDQG